MPKGLWIRLLDRRCFLYMNFTGNGLSKYSVEEKYLPGYKTIRIK
jgi:hypothetical protein